MDIRKLQRQAASSVDELLAISEDISKYIIPAYGTAPRETFDMQCRVQLERLKRLEAKLGRMQEELAAGKPGKVAGPGNAAGSEAARPGNAAGSEAARPGNAAGSEAARPGNAAGSEAAGLANVTGAGMAAGPTGFAVRLTQEQQQSLAVTGQIIAQNLLILHQKKELLNNFLAHSSKIQESLDTARELETQAEIFRLKNTLREELRPCQKENEE